MGLGNGVGENNLYVGLSVGAVDGDVLGLGDGDVLGLGDGDVLGLGDGDVLGLGDGDVLGDVLGLGVGNAIVGLLVGGVIFSTDKLLIIVEGPTATPG
jgi:hypothetical protein